jgi:uncharacterized membrane protein YphA (DoxX/SURF4 family)
MEEKEVDSMPILNGNPVPVELPLPDLARMLESPDMTDFSLACRALSLKQTLESYDLLKCHLPHRDPYRHRCLLEALFAFMIIVGYATRFAAFIMALGMFVEIFIIYPSLGWLGVERQILYIGIYATLVLSGAGRYGLGSHLERRRKKVEF